MFCESQSDRGNNRKLNLQLCVLRWEPEKKGYAELREVLRSANTKWGPDNGRKRLTFRAEESTVLSRCTDPFIVNSIHIPALQTSMTFLPPVSVEICGGHIQGPANVIKGERVVGE